MVLFPVVSRYQDEKGRGFTGKEDVPRLSFPVVPVELWPESAGRHRIATSSNKRNIFLPVLCMQDPPLRGGSYCIGQVASHDISFYENNFSPFLFITIVFENDRLYYVCCYIYFMT